MKLDDEALRAAYSAGGIRAARAALPGFSDAVLYKRARALGVARRPRWTADDLRRLRAQWDVEGIHVIARGLGRTVLTVYWKARQLGLRCGAPEGWEYVTEAARRCGYNASQLRRILRWAGARVACSQSRRLRGVGWRFHVVEVGEADEAVRRWHETETVQSAARRHGVDGATMARWLRDAGVALERVAPARGRRRTNKLHRRVLSADADRAAAQHRLVETLASASRRHGISTETMSAWLRAAGMRPAGYHWRSLVPAEVDAVVAAKRRR